MTAVKETIKAMEIAVGILKFIEQLDPTGYIGDPVLAEKGAIALTTRTLFGYLQSLRALYGLPEYLGEPSNYVALAKLDVKDSNLSQN